ncbi:TRAP transporter small permease [Falsiroseomonas oryzae]|uniref:TRAP transporter small permease n=1 Tax=Falsiroseomonas oryzae TaxID=2766473 RepID=UPI0022EB13A7|nr:TRAP transporter small permease subunit [Roseomonas sp. MO-31]
MQSIIWLVDRLNLVLTYLIGLLLAVMTFAVLTQVLVRFVLTAAGVNISAAWTEEVARYVLIWIVFLGAGIGCRRRQLISLEFVVRWLPPLPGQGLVHAGLLLCLGFFGLLISVGLAFMELGAVETSPVMQIPKAWVYAAMPAGASLMILNTAVLIAETLLQRRDIRTVADAAEGVE